MVKIKQKKTMNLPQLIEWVWKNEVIDKDLLSDNTITPLRINIGGEFIFNNDYVYSKNDTFTVEVEEEITEDTEFKELVGLDVDGAYWQYDNVCVYDFDLDRIKGIYIPNNDLTMTLIWTHEKGLVE